MNRKNVTMDGNTAAAHVSYAFTDVAAIYPISPSSSMAENADKWSTEGKENIFGQVVDVVEMQSEAGAAGTLHGILVGGGLATTFTCSQGLLLMIPNMYKMAGELLPAVINVSARAIATHALSIFGDHSDIYACRQTGFAMLGSTNPQEVMDLAVVAHISAVGASLPFMHFFDGYRTSDEIQKIKAWDYEQLKEFADFDAINAFRARSANPETPDHRGTAQNPDIFFQARESVNSMYENLPSIVEKNMEKVNKAIGTDYKLFNYYGASDADHVIVAMGSVCDTIEETIDYLNSKGGKVGLIKVRLFRPFSSKHFIDAIPKSVKTISVMDRTKEPGSVGEPLYLDIICAIRGTDFEKATVLNGRYGLASKDTDSAQIISVFKNKDKAPFTIGINDDVTNLSLPVEESPITIPEGTKSCKFWGLGSDGTVGANKNSVKIIGDNTDLYAQAYFAYDSKKSGGLTISHLRFGKSPIKSTYFVSCADFVSCHNASYINKYEMISELKPNGTFLLNCAWSNEEVGLKLSDKNKKYLAENNINLYIIDGVKIAKEIGLGGKINTILQSAFFKVSEIIPIEQATQLMKKAATDTYSRKGEAIVKMNHDAIDRGISDVKKFEIPEDWKNLSEFNIDKIKNFEGTSEIINFVNDIVIPVNEENGNNLPVSALAKYPGGVFPSGSAAFEKRGIATDIPCWNTENCIQCNLCSYVCPHGVIRPVVMTDEEAEKAPKDMKFIDMTAMPGHKFAITVSALDCTGCGSCINVCPGKKGEKALNYEPLESQLSEQDNFNYGQSIPAKPEIAAKFKSNTVKGSQFKKPLLEFSGACAGCGETPYAKLVTQLFGDRMIIANATGCSSIWGGSIPSTPYTVNEKGHGPAWANSLFEDNAEFGYGMLLAQTSIRNKLIKLVREIEVECDACRPQATAYLGSLEDGEQNKIDTANLIDALEKCGTDKCKKILKEKKYLSKKSMWVFGGDGWAYDIGFGGLDHVLASGENINVLVMDTEIYSNTGGQSSKSTPFGANAKFASSGKKVVKKDLAQIAMTYGYAYVAQIAQGADYNQCIKAIVEAESYDGPSLIIAYSPCISHGIKGGMFKSQTETKLAVESGYWNLFRFDPRLADQNKNPFQLDSKAPSADFKDFISNEIRYNLLYKKSDAETSANFDKAKLLSEKKYNHLKLLSELYKDSDN